ncbi:MAG TPA: S46 family peptidase [Prolixibacteraceae bacterium]|nr:S46 family peptidase [Prolixibacteraceae bacterium]
MFRKNILAFGFVLLSLSSLWAKEGMWIPTLLNKYNIEEMKQMGFRLTAEDIYSVNRASMKDAVVIFGGGCTGELISDKGLLITNHHCGFDAIQNHSSIEHDYLTDGFWAKNHQEELSNPELSVRFLERMDDVTEKISADTEGKTKDSVAAIITRNTKKIVTEASEEGKYEAVVQPLFYGNQYFLYVYQVFEDVRLVGAPPSSIGKFGGDTDNWMWPRHTGDFSLFRIYANKDNQPAKYSADNVPYKPKKFFKISIKGIQPEDFTLVLGYPGRTQEYLPSQAIRQIMEQSDPDKIKIRDLKLNLLSADMDKDAGVRIQYASKYASTSNAWKKWQGEVKGLRRLNAVATKQKFENEFKTWVDSNPDRKNRYGEVLPNFEKLFSEIAPYTKANDYYTEIVWRGTDIFSIISVFEKIEKHWTSMSFADQQKIQNAIQLKVDEYFREYNRDTDEKIFAALLRLYATDMNSQFLPEYFKTVMSKTTPEELISKIYRKSVFSDPVKLSALASGLNSKKLKRMSRDPAFKIFTSLKINYETNIEPTYNVLQKQIDENMKTYVAGIMDMNQGKPLWADANKTLRVAYGKVEGYKPMDGVTYDYFTTLKGIMQKDNPAIYDYNVPQALRDLYQKKDYGRYGKDGKMNVCFTASNHTTGGNSGSPVINAEGNLIGVNFDRCWEGTMSDLMFDPDRCRNIVLDIRFALFIIDKLEGAGYLLNEMVIED